eukprot:SAG11_NODE_7006_length_1209_cov_3.478378_2_plen_104_part_00
MICRLIDVRPCLEQKLGGLIAKYSREGNFEEVNKRVEQGVKAMAKQKEAQIKEEQKALCKAKMSSLKKENKELEAEVSDLEKEIRKLKKKLKAKVQESDRDSN